MVERQIERRGIRDERVLAAMLDIPREEFALESARGHCYDDAPASIGYGQTISQPYIVALMAQCLELTGKETVLEVGAGCGYHAAVLGALAARVITIETIPELAAMAKRNLEKTGYCRNVTVVRADGSQGWPGGAPYDAISVAAASAHVPPPLLAQLRSPGRMVIPVGDAWDQELRVLRKTEGKAVWRVATHCCFVPLRETAPRVAN